MSWLDRPLSLLPLSLLRRASGTRFLLPYYHVVSDEDLAHIKHLFQYPSVGAFAAALDFFLRNFRPVSVADLVAHVNRGQGLPDQAFLLTFDDGFREIHDIVAPLLVAKGVPAAFFVNPGFVDNKDLSFRCKASLLAEHLARGAGAPLVKTWTDMLAANHVPIAPEGVGRSLLSIGFGRRAMLDQLAAASDIDFGVFLAAQRPYMTSSQLVSLSEQGFHIGGHSVTHPRFAELDLDEQLGQAGGSLEFVDQLVSQEHAAFSFPFDDVGVSGAFYAGVHRADQVDAASPRRCDVTFGSSDMKQEASRRHFQRFWMEDGTDDPRVRVKRLFARICLRKALGANRMDH